MFRGSDSHGGYRKELRERANTILSQHNPDTEQSICDDLKTLIHDLSVHQVELELQNEELHRTQQQLELARNSFSRLYHHAPVGYLTLDRNGMILQANATFAGMLQGDLAELLGKPVGHILHADDRDQFFARYQPFFKYPDGKVLQTRIMRHDKTFFYARIAGRSEEAGVQLAPHNPAMPVVLISLIDVTDQVETQYELQIAAIAFNAQEGMCITDTAGNVLRVNPAFCKLTGYAAEEVVGKNPRILKSGRHDDFFYKRMWEQLRQNNFWQGEIWNRRKNGKIYPEWLCISAVLNDAGEPVHYVATFSDISYNKEAEAEIHRLAFYDYLTGLPNRRMFQERLQQALASCHRTKHHGALFLIDLDNFKTLNDVHGHEMGDQLLIEVSRRLRSILRECDTVARLGGDEFVILAEDLSQDESAVLAQAEKIAEKIRLSINEPFRLGELEYQTTPSIGIGLFYDNNMRGDELLRRADAAMYQAKGAGRNTLRFFDPGLQLKLENRLKLASELRAALPEGQFVLFYQLQVNYHGDIFGAELLLRWIHPERGMVSPAAFIPLAEETGLIIPIGQMVLETACRQLKAWESQAGFENLQLAVNVSARQFRQTDFVAELEDLLQASGINPSHLKLELTESLVVENVTDAIEKMQTLRAIGVGFSMDDFGTGYSSLSYLQQLPLCQLKIDQSFVRDLTSDRGSAAIVQTIIAMAHSLELQAIAEGVETEAQKEYLYRYGCETFQGYYFGRPVPCEDFEALVRSQARSRNTAT
ncbi:putative bifunctional diguanylate cyclase/phosphodiesterase [Chrysiogenes arsenatis]|uniref:putative bifunctional diguanylate cyclase/phosphodiesterase n=1 Tax=Chrysiogenes arsenatis TaxID=309797 RepID=UPI000417DE02|nr:bifunctional diguanylate cyclase/phosphodiesterase [Chrysiogenes arsenatis]